MLNPLLGNYISVPTDIHSFLDRSQAHPYSLVALLHLSRGFAHSTTRTHASRLHTPRTQNSDKEENRLRCCLYITALN